MFNVYQYQDRENNLRNLYARIFKISQRFKFFSQLYFLKIKVILRMTSDGYVINIAYDMNSNGAPAVRLMSDTVYTYCNSFNRSVLHAYNNSVACILSIIEKLLWTTTVSPHTR
jgi:hypothetical protein